VRSQDLTSGPIKRHLIKMSLFMGMVMIVQTLYGLIDLYWVGRLGSTAVAAVAIGTNLMMFTLALTQILSVGTLSLVSQAAGRKDQAEVSKIFNQSQMMSVALGTLFAVGMFIARETYCRQQSSDPETAKLVSEFLTWFIPAMFLQFPMMTMASALRGVGDMRTVALSQGGTILMNIVLAPFLIFGWGTGVPMGVEGAALATVISIAIGFAFLFGHVWKKGVFFAKGAGVWTPDFAAWRRIAFIGLPSGVEFAVVAVYYAFIIWVIRAFGPQAQAAFGIGMRIIQVGMLSSISVGFSSAAIAGQNFGAKLPNRVRENFKASLVVAVCCAVLLFLPIHLISAMLVSPFTDDPAVVAYGSDFLRLMSWNLIATAIIFPCFATFSGFGNTVPSLIGSVMRIATVIIFGYLLHLRSDFQILWIWKLSVAATFGQSLLGMIFVRREFGKNLGPLEREAEVAIPA